MASLIEILGIVFVATIFRTAFGFGEALIAVPLLALIIPVRIATPIAVFASVVVASFVVLRDWRHIHFRSVGWLIASTLFGIPLGLLLLKTVPEPVTDFVLACIIILYSGFSLFHPRRFLLKDDRLAWVFGFFAGITGGSYGMNGPPLAIYGTLKGWSPERFRATLQGYFLPASILGLGGYGLTGLWTSEVSRLSLWSLPVIMMGIFFGRRLNRRIDPRRFNFIIHGFLIFVATILLFQSGIPSFSAFEFVDKRNVGEPSR